VPELLGLPPITGNAEGPNISKRLTPEQKQELDRHLLSYSIQPKLKIAQPRRAKYSSLWFYPLNQRLTLVQGFAPVTGDCPSWDTHCPFVGMKIDGKSINLRSGQSLLPGVRAGHGRPVSASSVGLAGGGSGHDLGGGWAVR
jgi:hypothetical protein